MNLQLIMFALSFIPGAGPIVAAVQPWLPVIEKALPILEAGLPIAKDLISRGAQGVAAFQSAHPLLLQTVKELAAMASNGKLDASDISDDAAVAFASPLIGKPWTQADQQRWMDKATGDIG